MAKLNYQLIIIILLGGKKYLQILLFLKKRIYHINPNNIEVYENGEKILTFIDKISNTTKYDFIRIIDNQKYYIKNNKIILIIKELPTKYLSKLNPKKISEPKIITFDIETKLVDNVHKPYLFSSSFFY